MSLIKPEDWKVGYDVVCVDADVCSLIEGETYEISAVNITSTCGGWIKLKGHGDYKFGDFRFECHNTRTSHKLPANNVGTGMKFDGDKPRTNLLTQGCPLALLEISKVLTFGAKKYADNSWQTVPDGQNRYNAAGLRHDLAHALGEVNDPESGLNHLAHKACCALFELELELRKCKE